MSLTVYCAYITDEWFVNEYQYFVQRLNSTDKKRFNTMKSELKRKQLVLSRALISEVLHTPKHPEPYSYQIIDYRQLVINNCKKYSVSISHSQDMVAIAIDERDILIGVDIERIKQRNVEALSKEFCTNDEYLVLKSNENALNNFYKIWTVKEALTKATGLDLYQIFKFDCSSVIGKKRSLVECSGTQFIVENTFISSNRLINKNECNNFIGTIAYQLQSAMNKSIDDALLDSLKPIVWINYTKPSR